MDEQIIQTIDHNGNIVFLNLKKINDKHDLINPTAHLSNPELLSDAAYLKQNIKHLNIKYKDYPEELRKNDLFTLEYFSSIGTTKKEYKDIPPHLLKNNFFVSACLEKNPDIYLLADSSCHSEYSLLTLKIHHPYSFLKYANENLLNDKKFCIESIKKVNSLNYQYIPETLRKDFDICKETVGNAHGESLIKFLEYLPEEILNNFDFIKELTKINIGLFQYLPEKYRSDKPFCLEVVKKNSKFFEFTAESIKNDITFFNDLESFHTKINSQWNSELTRNFKLIEILKFLPTHFFDKELSEKYKKELKDHFQDLSKIHRGNLNIIRAVYSQNGTTSSPDNLFLVSYSNRFTHKDFREAFQYFIKQNSKLGGRGIQEKILSFIDTFILQEDLNENLSNNNQTKTNKMKI